MSPEEQYPSADDVTVLTRRECLVNSRKRVELGWSVNTYIDGDGSGDVCAIGGIFAEDGLRYGDINDAFDQAPGSRGEWFIWLLENKLSEVARDSIALVNKVAARRHPEFTPECAGNWSGPLEWVNQSWMPPGINYRYDPDGRSAIKAEVLAIYDEAIAEA